MIYRKLLLFTLLINLFLTPVLSEDFGSNAEGDNGLVCELAGLGNLSMPDVIISATRPGPVSSENAYNPPTLTGENAEERNVEIVNGDGEIELSASQKLVLMEKRPGADPEGIRQNYLTGLEDDIDLENELACSCPSESSSCTCSLLYKDTSSNQEEFTVTLNLYDTTTDQIICYFETQTTVDLVETEDNPDYPDGVQVFKKVKHNDSINEASVEITVSNIASSVAPLETIDLLEIIDQTWSNDFAGYKLITPLTGDECIIDECLTPSQSNYESFTVKYDGTPQTGHDSRTITENDPKYIASFSSSAGQVTTINYTVKNVDNINIIDVPQISLAGCSDYLDLGTTNVSQTGGTYTYTFKVKKDTQEVFYSQLDVEHSSEGPQSINYNPDTKEYIGFTNKTGTITIFYDHDVCGDNKVLGTIDITSGGLGGGGPTQERPTGSIPGFDSHAVTLILGLLALMIIVKAAYYAKKH